MMTSGAIDFRVKRYTRSNRASYAYSSLGSCRPFNLYNVGSSVRDVVHASYLSYPIRRPCRGVIRRAVPHSRHAYLVEMFDQAFATEKL